MLSNLQRQARSGSVRQAALRNFYGPEYISNTFLEHFDFRRGTSEFRRMVYRENLWVNLFPAGNRRLEPAPEHFRSNLSMTDRFRPWLNRELNCLLSDQEDRTHVLEIIVQLLTQHRISSPQFREAVLQHLRTNTDHFIHELFEFIFLYKINLYF